MGRPLIWKTLSGRLTELLWTSSSAGSLCAEPREIRCKHVPSVPDSKFVVLLERVSSKLGLSNAVVSTVMIRSRKTWYVYCEVRGAIDDFFWEISLDFGDSRRAPFRMKLKFVSQTTAIYVVTGHRWTGVSIRRFYVDLQPVRYEILTFVCMIYISDSNFLVWNRGREAGSRSGTCREEPSSFPPFASSRRDTRELVSAAPSRLVWGTQAKVSLSRTLPYF